MTWTPEKEAELAALEAEEAAAAPPPGPRVPDIEGAKRESAAELRDPSIGEKAHAAAMGLGSKVAAVPQIRGAMEAVGRQFGGGRKLGGGVLGLLGPMAPVPAHLAALLDESGYNAGRDEAERDIAGAQAGPLAAPFGAGQLVGDAANAAGLASGAVGIKQALETGIPRLLKAAPSFSPGAAARAAAQGFIKPGPEATLTGRMFEAAKAGAKGGVSPRAAPTAPPAAPQAPAATASPPPALEADELQQFLSALKGEAQAAAPVARPPVAPPAPAPAVSAKATELATESRLPPSQIMGAAGGAGRSADVQAAADALTALPSKARADAIRQLAAQRGADFAKKAAAKAGLSTKTLGL